MKYSQRLPGICAVVAALNLAACQATPPLEQTEPPRDLMAYAKKTQGASIVDVDVFQPQAKIGEKCSEQPLLSSKQQITPALAAALAKADAYSKSTDGVGFLVLKDGQKIFESYSDGTGPETPTNSYSMHKSVVAMVIGQAISDGVISTLDDPVGDYIAEWRGDDRGQITLRQLLTMSSGIKYYAFGAPGSKSLELSFGADIDSVALDHPLDLQPGSEFAYQNVNSQIVGVALDRALKAAGKGGYVPYLEDRLWCAVGNGAAGLWLDRPGGSVHYAAGLFSGIENWARIGELLRNDGKVGARQILAPDWAEQMTSPSATNPNYGLHIWLDGPDDGVRRYSSGSQVTVTHSSPYKAPDVAFFDGFGGQRVYVIPSAGLTIVRTGNINMKYDDAIIVNLILSAMDQ